MGRFNKYYFAVAIFLSTNAFAGNTGVIEVDVTGLKHDKGKLNIRLHDNATSFPGKPAKSVKGVSVKIENRQAHARFEDVTYGEYAIAVYHDENNNGELDTNFIGIPSEAVGASNNAKGRFGPPKFKDARFVVNKPLTNQSISMNYETQ